MRLKLKHLLLHSFVVAVAAIPMHLAIGQDKPAAADPAAADPAPTEVDEGSTIEKASYVIGFSWLQGHLIKSDYEYDFDQIMAGLKAAHERKDIGMSDEERASVMEAYQNIYRTKKLEQQKADSEKNRIEGETAMKQFAAQDGAKELEDGVMYVVLKEGDGEIPEAPDRVRLNYKGTYANGEVFESSYDRGQPIDNGVMQFVTGFSKSLQNMKVGSKWKIIIRGDKAYGMRPRPPMEVNKTLIFEIELLEILDPQ